MAEQASMMNELKTKAIARLCKRETFLFGIGLFFVVVLQEAAFEDRLLLILYYLGALGAAYCLIRRAAIGFAAALVAVAGATIFSATYFGAKPDNWSPWVDGARDLIGLGLLLGAIYAVLRELYRFQRDAKERELKQLAEKKMIQMRAAALRSTSHEVRTPLTTITALCETLSDGLAGELNEAQKEFLKDIDDAARHLLALVNDILDYAKVEAGMIKLAPESLALAELVEQCLAMVQPKADTAGVSLSAHVAPDLKEIIADPLRLKQILLNLLSNAVKYNERGGSVNVRLRPDGEHVLISVRDTGRGIGPEHMPHLFDPYYQTAVADQSIGTGLGLAIIKHLSELHGGSVHVESVVGAGSVFTVRLPKAAHRTSGTLAEAVHELATTETSTESSPDSEAAVAAL